MKISIDTMNDASEIIHYDSAGIPIYIRCGKLSYYPEMRANGHWHEDLELILVTEGFMNYRINGQTILLKEGDLLFVNSRQMHYGSSTNGSDCTFFCLLFHPSLLASNKILYQAYVAPLIDPPCTDYILLSKGDTKHSALCDLVLRVIEKKEEHLPGYELYTIGLFFQIWSDLLPLVMQTETPKNACSDSDLRIQKDMVSFIYQHYSEKLSLTQIAASGGVCRSKCCKIFKQYLMQSPIDFVNSYRLQVSCDLLRNSDMSITDIAFHCGFNHLSYYIELFNRTYQCSPSTYRKKER